MEITRDFAKNFCDQRSKTSPLTSLWRAYREEKKTEQKETIKNKAVVTLNETRSLLGMKEHAIIKECGNVQEQKYYRV